MAKAILTTKVDPTYDDLPEQRYHFPRTYLRQVEAARGDWVVYYEPRRPSGDLMKSGGRQAYFATARIADIIPDPSKPDHFYALIEDFLPFDHAVPFKEADHYYESGLRKDGSTNKGAFGRAVRNIPDVEYDPILAAGFAHVLGKRDRERPTPDPVEEAHIGFGDNPQMPYEADSIDRRMVTQVLQRPFRDRAFAAAIKTAYHDTCAITGLKLINGGGRSEVQAAHIRPVADGGPDSVRNGLALSGTVHWMFDRGLISVDDDYRLLIACDGVPDTITRLINLERRLLVPTRADERPHSQFLQYHREQVFKG
ncbi:MULTISPECIES: HNH endonuclease [unclassified Rhizobium]|uniref:HNH endonuclease n=1 Tax=unclassified Rhizobium TaxID=2613769 RepID=UPI000BE8E3D5|nr:MULTISPECIES: HNH endonuclease [unclassified Rhizobium]MDF0660826.1 HNH endonuclease [Rhizobium sp. BC49]PDS85509.1 restriction endonuclease [Rhizobium sp. L18]